MSILEKLLSMPQYSLGHKQKNDLLLKGLNELTAHHRRACPEYNRILSVMGQGDGKAVSLNDVPYLPVSLFKTHRLLSIGDDEIFKTLTSSGTISQQVSRIFLDRKTANLQSRSLISIMTHILGPKRLPMIIVDTDALFKDRTSFSARGAGVLGMMSFGRNHFYALDENMDLNLPGLKSFLNIHGGSPFLIFGFTFMIWQYFLTPLINSYTDLRNGILIHSGGWKKLSEESVDNIAFKDRLLKFTGLSRVFNFYGMVEQTGNVFLEGQDGYLFTPNFAEVIIRDPSTWQEAPLGHPGVIQVLSLLPWSYPGHSLLTADLGVIHGQDDAPCGRLGRYFSVLGRVPRAELRGCSDVHAYQFGV